MGVNASGGSAGGDPAAQGAESLDAQVQGLQRLLELASFDPRAELSAIVAT